MNKKITVSDVLRVCNGKMFRGNESLELEDFSKDTRTIRSGEVYVGIKGENFDGNKYFKEAINKGAIACILDNSVNEDEIRDYDNIILVDNTIIALQEIAKYKRSLYDIPVVAVTGSVGKTSTKDIIYSVLSTKYNVLKTEGNNNNHIGLPLTILKLKDHDAMVVEMGMNHFGEISLLSNIAKPTIAVITNIGTSHIGILGSRENILKAKLEILDGMSKDGLIIVNNDNDLLNKWKNENYTKYNIRTYGIENESDYFAYDINIGENISTYFINNKKVTLNLPGKVFIYNSLCAIAVGDKLGINLDDMIDGLKDVSLTKRRMEIIEKDGIKIINDAYNSSYDSLKASIEYLNKVSGNRKIAVLGDMLELGDYSKELHEKVVDVLYENKVDILITVGKYVSYMADKAIELGLKEVYKCMNNQEAIDKVKILKKGGDVILVKASNSMKFDEIVKNI